MGQKRPHRTMQGAGAAGQIRQAHVHTGVASNGLGQAAIMAPGRLAKGPVQELYTSQPAAKWSPHKVPASACLSNPSAAVELELARALALDHLRHKLNSLCAKAGLRNVPLLAFERWRFAAKWAEDEPAMAAAALDLQDSSNPAHEPADAAADNVMSSPRETPRKKQKIASDSKTSSTKFKQQPTDAVVPFSSLPIAPEPGLVGDLLRPGLDAEAAISVALQLATAASAAAAGIMQRRHQLVSGKPASCPAVAVSFHKHSLDITCGRCFVKVSRTSYGKLARLYRLHWLEHNSNATATVASKSTVGLPLEAAAAKVRELEATTGTAGSVGADNSKPGPVRSDADSSDDEGTAVIGSSGSSSQHHVVLCAEARIAELEQQGQQQGAAACESSPAISTRHEFHQRLFVLLMRYKSIQGHGFQAAAGPPVFELLRRQLSVGFECFASPLNAHFSSYGSAFPDVDGPFGSAGSFFRMQLKHGSYEVNPPFVPSILNATAQHILEQLQAAESAGGAVSFVVLMPGWQEVQGWQLLNSSSFLRQSLLVAAADHGYCDGASHQRKDLYRQSPFDSAVMFMQTTAAAKKWPVREQLLVDLRAAMAQCCPTTAAAERQRQQRGQRDMEWLGLIPGTGLESQQSQQQHIKQRKGKRKKLSQQHRPLLEGEKHAKKSAKQRKNYKEPRAAPS